ncbi:hypothetical protein AGMMS49992_24620 [Clostridia bacterium]|nr:hypothetical protein AGMMS49992_24620 [Clostridia bacterium]
MSAITETNLTASEKNRLLEELVSRVTAIEGRKTVDDIDRIAKEIKAEHQTK